MQVSDPGSIFFSAKKVKTTTKKFAFTQAEKDSIYSLIKHMAGHPVTPKSFCTDFAGRI
jgi:hypothetical protein